MRTITDNLRRVAGIILLGVLAFLIFVVFRLTFSSSSPQGNASSQGEPTSPGIYPPPVAILESAAGQSYPAPGGTSLPEPGTTPGGTPWQVSALPALKAHPTPGPFGEMRLLYVDHAKHGFFVVDLNGEELFQWPTWPEDQNFGDLTSMLRVSPDGSQILYSVWVEGPGYRLSDLKRDSIWVMNPDGNDKRRLVSAAENWYPVDAIWSPDGRQIAYRAASLDPVSLMPASRELWVMNADGSEPRRLLNDEKLLKLGMEAPALFFRWMGNGYLYFAVESLYAVNPEDGSLYRLMDGVDALDLRFSLSPDGHHAWGYTEVPVGSLSAAGFQTMDLPENYGVVWSPDGSQLAYVATGEGGTWLLDLVSEKKRQVLPYIRGENVQLKAFSPDNRYLAYQTDAGLYIIDLESKSLEPKLVLADPHEPVSGYQALDFLAWIPVP
jgi:WD40 repeat protein